MPLSKTDINVILVDENDNPIGKMEKIEAHEKGLLHRAFSVMFVRYDKDNNLEVLLQKRASSKYHCGGLWSNTCCSHPLEKESVLDAAKRRLPEELGLSQELLENIELKSIGSFIYKAKLDNELTEHEYDHVIISMIPEDSQINFTDSSEIQVSLNKDEISEIKWINLKNIYKNLQEKPLDYTPWLKSVLMCISPIITKPCVNNQRNA